MRRERKIQKQALEQERLILHPGEIIDLTKPNSFIDINQPRLRTRDPTVSFADPEDVQDEAGDVLAATGPHLDEPSPGFEHAAIINDDTLMVDSPDPLANTPPSMLHQDTQHRRRGSGIILKFGTARRDSGHSVGSFGGSVGPDSPVRRKLFPDPW